MTPRNIRKAIAANKIRIKSVPDPPQEWGDYRQERLQVAIFCAVYWIKGWEAEKIKKKLGLVGISKQRMAQYVQKGCKFMMDRGCLG